MSGLARRLPALALLGVLGVLGSLGGLGACADPTVTVAPGAGPTGTGVPASLTITVGDGSGATSTSTLSCLPAAGDHPDPDAACAALADAWPEAFEPPDPDLACTEIYGGPETARITGTVDGRQVDASFARTDGCQIHRWDAVSALFAVSAR